MNQNNKPIIQCQCQTFTSTFVPLRSIKLTLGFILADAVSFLLLVRFEAAANKNHTIFLGQARDTGKLKNKVIFDSQEYERDALPNLRCWLTTSSCVTACLLDIPTGNS